MNCYEIYVGWEHIQGILLNQGVNPKLNFNITGNRCFIILLSSMLVAQTFWEGVC